MKKILASFSVIITILTFAGCSNISNVNVNSGTQMSVNISNYFKENLEYTLKDLRVVEEEDGSFTVVSTLGTEYSIDDFVSYAERMVQISESAAKELDVTFFRINPTLYTGENTWIGWGNKSFTFYDHDKYLVENVSLQKLKDEVENYKNKMGYATSDDNIFESPSSRREKNEKFEKALYYFLQGRSVLTQLCSEVHVYTDSGTTIYINLVSYESYSFAAIVTESVAFIKENALEYTIRNPQLVVTTPSAKYMAVWKSEDLNLGYLVDTHKDFSAKVSLEELQELYGYEGLF